MESEYTKSDVLVHTINRGQLTGQELAIADNRPYAVSQAKFIGVIQRRATFNRVGIPQEVRDFRKDKMKPVYPTRLGNETIYIGGAMREGFGMNAGNIDGGPVTFNDGNIHTEPKLINIKYGGDVAGGWLEANRVAGDRGKNPDGTSANHFDLFTEREPCDRGQNCKRNLMRDEYKSNDNVNYFFGDGVSPADVARSYLGEAQQKYSNYDVKVDVSKYEYGLVGTKKA